MENSLLKCDFRWRDQDEEANSVKGTKVQVLCAGVRYGTHMGEQLSGHCQLDWPYFTPLYEVLCINGSTHSCHYNEGPNFSSIVTLPPVCFSPEQVSFGLEDPSLGLGESFEHCVFNFFGLCLLLRLLSSDDC